MMLYSSSGMLKVANGSCHRVSEIDAQPAESIDTIANFARQKYQGSTPMSTTIPRGVGLTRTLLLCLGLASAQLALAQNDTTVPGVTDTRAFAQRLQQQSAVADQQLQQGRDLLQQLASDQFRVALRQLPQHMPRPAAAIHEVFRDDLEPIQRRRMLEQIREMRTSQPHAESQIRQAKSAIRHDGNLSHHRRVEQFGDSRRSARRIAARTPVAQKKNRESGESCECTFASQLAPNHPLFLIRTIRFIRGYLLTERATLLLPYFSVPHFSVTNWPASPLHDRQDAYPTVFAMPHSRSLRCKVRIEIPRYAAACVRLPEN